MSIAEELAKKWGTRTGGNAVEFVDRNFRAAINEALERAAHRIEAKIGSLAVARDRAHAAGREGVAACRQSDMETCERMAAEVRALKSPAHPIEPSDERHEHV